MTSTDFLRPLGTTDGNARRALLLLILAASACCAQSQLSLNHDKWLDISTGKIPLRNEANGPLYFDFPEISPFISGTDQGSMHYLETVFHSPITNYTAIRFVVDVATTGFPAFNYELEPSNVCPTPAHARLIIDTGGSGQFDRWWSDSIAYTLVAGAGPVTMKVPLSPDHWSSVYGLAGNNDATAFAGFMNALQEVRYLGLTFGGGCFYGHGVSVSGGSARFRILSAELLSATKNRGSTVQTNPPTLATFTLPAVMPHARENDQEQDDRRH